jgi:CRP/FNR family transcriptional regulator, cyclic AMP receptor protein
MRAALHAFTRTVLIPSPGRHPLRYGPAVLKDPGGWPTATFLADLAPTLRQELLELGVEHRYVRGEVVLHQGDVGRFVVILLEGLVKVSTLSVYGDETLLSLRTRGDLLGEMGFATDSPRSARVVAATPVRATVITEAKFSHFLERHPEQAMRVAAVVARKLRRANECRAEFHSLMARARVAAILVETADTIGSPEHDGVSIGPELTQADLASLATVSLSTFEKLLQSLEQEGLVKRHRRALVIIRTDRLREIAGYAF